MESVARPFPVADAPQEGTERTKPPYGGRFGGTIATSTPGLGAALLLTLDGKWIKHVVARRGPWLVGHDDVRRKMLPS